MSPLQWGLLLSCLGCAVLPGARAQFPQVCVTVRSLVSRECCPPLGAESTNVCGSREGCGQCTEVQADTRRWSGPYTLRNRDDRERWRRKFFNHTCKCTGVRQANGTLDSHVMGLHNLVHAFLNGTSALPHSAANNPIFVVLHAFTDAIFDEWMKRFNPSADAWPWELAPIGHNRMYNMVSFFPPVTNEEFFSTADQLGYNYAVDMTISVEETPSGTTTFLVAVGMLVALVGLLALLAFLQYRRLRKGYMHLMEAHFNNKRYTEEA